MEFQGCEAQRDVSAASAEYTIHALALIVRYTSDTTEINQIRQLLSNLREFHTAVLVVTHFDPALVASRGGERAYHAETRKFASKVSAGATTVGLAPVFDVNKKVTGFLDSGLDELVKELQTVISPPPLHHRSRGREGSLVHTSS